jgi:hypothetical protein
VEFSSKQNLVRSVNRVARKAMAAFATVAVLLCSHSASGQIAKMTDEHGKTIYVNADSPKPHHGSTISSASAVSPAVAARISQTSLANAFPGRQTPLAEPKTVDYVRLDARPTDSRLDRIVNEAAQRHQVDPGLVRAVIAAESGWNSRAISRKGAVGLMQLIPGTAQKYGARNLFDPAQNIEAGTTYLKSLLVRYDNDLSKTLAAYNAGENAVDRFGGVPAYPETQKYVQKVTDRFFETNSSGTASHWAPPRTPVRKSADTSGRVTFTNE